MELPRRKTASVTNRSSLFRSAGNERSQSANVFRIGQPQTGRADLAGGEAKSDPKTAQTGPVMAECRFLPALTGRITPLCVELRLYGRPNARRARLSDAQHHRRVHPQVAWRDPRWSHHIPILRVQPTAGQELALRNQMPAAVVFLEQQLRGDHTILPGRFNKHVRGTYAQAVVEFPRWKSGRLSSRSCSGFRHAPPSPLLL